MKKGPEAPVVFSVAEAHLDDNQPPMLGCTIK